MKADDDRPGLRGIDAGALGERLHHAAQRERGMLGVLEALSDVVRLLRHGPKPADNRTMHNRRKRETVRDMP